MKIATYSRFAACALALAGQNLPARAGDVDAEMNNMFGTMTSSSSPSLRMNARRGVIDGGGFSVRSRISRPNLVNYDPPTLGGGCSGIDLQAGSLSFISKEQFTQLGKNVMSNAAGYAFGLALGAACQDCRTMMDKMMKDVQDMNKHLQSSCQIAEKEVERSGLGAGIRSLGENVGAAIRGKSGSASDDADAAQPKSGESVAQTAAKEHPQEMLKLMPGNIVWKALQKSNASSWWPGGSTKFDEAIMSLTGTVIGCVQGAGSDCAPGTQTTPSTGEAGVQVYTRKIPFNLVDLIGGTKSTGVQVFNCHGSVECLNPIAEPADFEGMQAIVHRALFGDDGVSGVVPQMSIVVDGQSTPEGDKLLAALGSDGQLLRRLANQNPSGATAFAADIEDSLVLDFSYRLATQMLDSAETAVSNLQSPGAKDAMTLISDRKKDLADEYSVLQSQKTRSSYYWLRAMAVMEMGGDGVIGASPVGGPGRTN